MSIDWSDLWQWILSGAIFHDNDDHAANFFSIGNIIRFAIFIYLFNVFFFFFFFNLIFFFFFFFFMNAFNLIIKKVNVEKKKRKKMNATTAH